MALSTLGRILEATPQFERLRQAVQAWPVNARVQVLSEAVPFSLAALLRATDVPMLLLAPRPDDARRIHEQLLVWTDGNPFVLHLPETETLPFERLVPDVDTTQQRLHTLTTALKAGAERRPFIVVCSTVALAQKTIARETFESSRHTLKVGDTVDLDDTLDLWHRMGYIVEPNVDVPGLVSRRGGIIDVFPPGAEAPARIELWGDEIDSIRTFDPETQLSTGLVDSVTVIPTSETLPGLANRERLDMAISRLDLSNSNDKTRRRMMVELDNLRDGQEVEDLDFYSGLFNDGSLLDYLPEQTAIISYRPPEIAEAAWAADEETHNLRGTKEARGDLPYNFPSSHLLWNEVEQRTHPFKRRLEITPWGAEELTHQDIHNLPFLSASDHHGNLDRFVADVAESAGMGHRVVAATSVPKRLGEIFDERDVHAEQIEDMKVPPEPGSIALLHAPGAGLTDGFVLAEGDHKLVVYSDSEIFGMAKQRRSSRRRRAHREALLSELNPGDFVVHVEHGIGKFLGTGQAPRDDRGREHLIIEYAAGDTLYVPMDHLDRVAPFVAPMDRPPTLTRLGSQEWKKTKARVAQSTKEMAAELLTLYASRELVEGQTFDPDTPWQTELEDAFPFEETPDQQQTIHDVKADMEQSQPMDRLVCGDVGYGKTEVALRAAFKAVMSGKQVAVLVPTTVLAQQHYVTFSQRLAAYPVDIEVLSRFRTDGEQHDIIEGLAEGRIDVCIGTHRLIQSDVRFKDLGLVVVDEEQRFGVSHKERLKQMRHEVDVLTLTATPIPRTLHLSLAGVRDMSTIETPPEERLPIKTYVSEFSDELVTEAIRRELDRQGQVYFLHNRVYNIDYMANYISRLVPEAKVGVAHGQMPEHELEEAMLAFAAGDTDVLTCTTIIESGLDIPNANTLIVDRADTFGLSQLYQLRGRVGRASRRAYTYLLLPPSKSITETAEKRLKTILAATELGSGFHIAMKDLEIRGAGNVLGSQQSGHIHAVGFDLYTRLLSNAVEILRAQRESGVPIDDAVDGTPADEAIEDLVRQPSVNLGIPASIPDDYVTDLPTRLSVYRRLGTMTSESEVDAVESELVDRFGPLPLQVQNLLYVVRLKQKAAGAGVNVVLRENGRITLRMDAEVGGARPALQRLMPEGATVGNAQIRLQLDELSTRWETALTQTLDALVEFHERMTSQLEAAATLSR